MSKSSHYYISGVWKDGENRITNVMLHAVIDDTKFVPRGIKKSKNSILKLIKEGYIIKTLVWLYPNWSVGAKVSYETISGIEYLRTFPDSTTKNNLDNSLLMENFID